MQRSGTPRRSEWGRCTLSRPERPVSTAWRKRPAAQKEAKRVPWRTLEPRKSIRALATQPPTERTPVRPRVHRRRRRARAMPERRRRHAEPTGSGKSARRVHTCAAQAPAWVRACPGLRSATAISRRRATRRGTGRTQARRVPTCAAAEHVQGRALRVRSSAVTSSRRSAAWTGRGRIVGRRARTFAAEGGAPGRACPGARNRSRAAIAE
jgi:hypothetical protein